MDMDLKALTITTNDKDVIKHLIEISHEAKKNSYCPYSKYPVGAALLVANCNKIFTGCNVENASSGLSICAERTAMAKAISEGFQQFKAIAVASNAGMFISPCGACRQFMAEFNLDCEVYMTKPDHSYQKLLVRELLPEPFVPNDLRMDSKENDI